MVFGGFNFSFVDLIHARLLACSVNYRVMPFMHKMLFGVSITMFMISAVVLGLIMQELNTDSPLDGNRRAQIILAITQVICENFPCGLNLVTPRHL